MPAYTGSLAQGGVKGAAFATAPRRTSSTSLAERKSLLGFALDRCGSMGPLATVAVKSVNELIAQQKALNVSQPRFTLTLFNQSVQLIHDGVPLLDVLPLLPSQYEPAGGTALNDAVAHLIQTLAEHAKGRNRPVLAAILTDGEENDSHRYRLEGVRQMVTYRRLTHGWQFLFLGPKGALTYALSIGISKANVVGFQTSPDGLRLMLEQLSKSMVAYQLGDSRFMLKLRGRT